MKRKRAKKANYNYAKLEMRRVLTAVASASAGSLTVEGDADGLVEVIATGDFLDESYSVRDNGVEIGNFDGINVKIKVVLNQDGPAQDNSVFIDLNKQFPERVVVDLGNGADNFEIIGNRFTGADPVENVIYTGGTGSDTVITDLRAISLSAELDRGNDSVAVNGDMGLIRFIGGQGADTLSVAEDTFAAEATIVLGPGNDVLNFEGRIYDPTISAGSGDDTVNFTADSVVSDIYVHLGSGDNVLNLDGWIAGDLEVRGGNGNDIVGIADTANVWGDASIFLGSGNNTFNINGNFNGSQSLLLLDGKDGDDDVNIGLTSEIRGSVRAYLGEGDNSLHNEGSIEGYIFATSKNLDDVFENFGDVDGRVQFRAGWQR